MPFVREQLNVHSFTWLKNKIIASRTCQTAITMSTPVVVFCNIHNIKYGSLDVRITTHMPAVIYMIHAIIMDTRLRQKHINKVHRFQRTLFFAARNNVFETRATPPMSVPSIRRQIRRCDTTCDLRTILDFHATSLPTPISCVRRRHTQLGGSLSVVSAYSRRQYCSGDNTLYQFVSNLL